MPDRHKVSTVTSCRHIKNRVAIRTVSEVEAAQEVSRMMSLDIVVMALTLLLPCQKAAGALPSFTEGSGELLNPYQAASVVLEPTSKPRNSIILLTDDRNSHFSDSGDLCQLVAPWGVAVFEVAVDGQDANVTQAQLSRVVDKARRLRQVSWCVTVVGAMTQPSSPPSLSGPQGPPPGVWSTRLLVVTRRPLPEAVRPNGLPLTSMMNTMLVILKMLLCNPVIS
ncbi:uncharacterized protein LOC121873915 [Homarus americanus]|uniref:uncharacterized protein LOC121873915 n=1 Tax=Homarus americanus TaxID=6706 RepID=UPI001C484576|nr:uncharacterized protein LOC121873915 [Homarus americanus]